MARYNREFLVPYLQNICALHLACQKLNKEIHEWDEMIHELKVGQYFPEPEEPSDENPYTTGRISSIIFGILGILSSFVVFSDAPEDELAFRFFLFIIVLLTSIFVFIVFPIGLIQSTKAENVERIRRYQYELDYYNKVKASNAEKRARIPEYVESRDYWSHELQQVKELLRYAYSANIIPTRYRDRYAAIYLYDWFSTSRADDLDAALNMFVLEEIKEKLDTIIANQSEIILNQCMMLANQQKSLDQQQRHSAMMRSKLNQIAASNEERNIYLSMIESNTAATAYFAAADYISKL